ncbi:hypothetical protein [Paraherbaspirillum soli]|uniref:Holin n=1 Tax=Paraherbaspirillum soli TaxID=631222 RepID=A0ABW0M9V7_9BURK
MAINWLFAILLSGLLGAVGQGIRVISGLKKLSDEAAITQKKFSDLFSAPRFGISMLIGFAAGAIGFLSLNVDPAATLNHQQIVTLLGIGYAGADFIEAFMNKELPK